MNAVFSELRPDAQPWIDLSTAINPNPYPAPRASALARARLPDPQELSKLEVAAARTFGVADPRCVLATAGSESALRLLPHLLPAVTEAIIVWPTCSSHIEAWQRLGVTLSRIPSIERASPVSGAVITLMNPNSPDGSVTSREQLLEAHDKVAACDGFLVVDEAFADADPTCSVADLAGSERCPRLLVLRSFGTFYGLAGVRLGFMIGAPKLIEPIRAALGDWPVAADAITAGLAAYTDQLWAERTRLRLRSATRRLNALLTQSGFTIVGGTSLFRLAHSELAPARYKQLLNAGIRVRSFDHDTRLLRFGLPHGETSWRRLREALRTKPKVA
jgi:cobalamin biosynthetic protein CobC